MYIILSDKRFPSSEKRGNLVYIKFLKKKIKVIETSDWYKSFYFKFLIIFKIFCFNFFSYKKKKYIICLKFTPFLLLKICKFLGGKIIYDCDDTIWINSHFGKKKSYKIFKLSNLIVFENYFLKRNFDKIFLDKFHNQIINCTLPDYKINQDNKKINKFIPTFCYIGSLWNYKEILPLLSKIDSYNLPWNLNLLGSNINKNNYKNLINLKTLENYNTIQMCQFMDLSDIGIYSKAISPFDRGRGFHKKLLYLSRGLPIVSIFSFDRKINTKSHILLNNCWSVNKILHKSLKLKNLKIIANWNSYVYKRFERLINLNT